MRIIAMNRHGDFSAGAIMINEGTAANKKRTILQIRGHFFFHKGHISLHLSLSQKGTILFKRAHFSQNQYFLGRGTFSFKKGVFF